MADYAPGYSPGDIYFQKKFDQRCREGGKTVTYLPAGRKNDNWI